MSGLQGQAAEAAWIRARLANNWTADAVIAWDNAASSPPTSHIRVSISPTGGSAITIGSTSPQFRYDGVVIVEVLTPSGEGTGENEALCDAVAEIFRHATGPGIRFFTPFPTRVGVTDGWFKQDVICAYERDTIYE